MPFYHLEFMQILLLNANQSGKYYFRTLCNFKDNTMHEEMLMAELHQFKMVELIEEWSIHDVSWMFLDHQTSVI